MSGWRILMRRQGLIPLWCIVVCRNPIVIWLLENTEGKTKVRMNGDRIVKLLYRQLLDVESVRKEITMIKF